MDDPTNYLPDVTDPGFLDALAGPPPVGDRALPAQAPADAWTIHRTIDGSQNLPQALTDGAGVEWVISLDNPMTYLHLVTYQNGERGLERDVVLPDGWRASGFGLSDTGRVWAYVHLAGVNQEISYAIPEWVPRSGGGGPPPIPGPPGDTSEARVLELIRQELANYHGGGGVTPDDITAIVAGIAQAANTATPLNHALRNAAQGGAAVALSEAPLITTANMGPTYAASFQIMQQIDNRVFAVARAQHLIEAAYKQLGLPWPPQDPEAARDLGNMNIFSPEAVRAEAERELAALTAAAQARWAAAQSDDAGG